MSTYGAIPLRNIWLLFLYAADMVQLRDRFDHDVEAARDLPELLGRLLTTVVDQRLRRNLSRGYRVRSATLSRVRGRIDLLETETRQLMDRGQIACSFDEHTMDTPRNRLVRAALDRLAGRIANADVAHRCRTASGDFGRLGVSVNAGLDLLVDGCRLSGLSRVSPRSGSKADRKVKSILLIRG